MATPKFRWNPTKRRFIDGDGKTVAPSKVRGEIDRMITAGRARVNALTTQYRDGAINVSQWWVSMTETIKAVHSAAGQIAVGGWRQMSASDRGRLAQRLKSQYEYFKNFGMELEAGALPLDGRLNARAALYMESARGTFEEMRRSVEKAGGMQEERRVTHAGDHCVDCVAFASRDWQPIGSLPPIGDSQCGPNCNCTFEYR